MCKKLSDAEVVHEVFILLSHACSVFAPRRISALRVLAWLRARGMQLNAKDSDVTAKVLVKCRIYYDDICSKVSPLLVTTEQMYIIVMANNTTLLKIS